MTQAASNTFRLGRLYLINQDIVHIFYEKKLRLEVEDLLTMKEFRLDAIGKKPFYTILDMKSSLAKASNEAKVWAAVNKESAEMRLLDVFVVSTLSMRIRVGLYLKMFKPRTETKMVKNLQDALQLIAKHRAERYKRLSA